MAIRSSSINVIDLTNRSANLYSQRICGNVWKLMFTDALNQNARKHLIKGVG